MAKIKKVVVAGCLPERQKQKLLQKFSQIDAVICLGQRDNIADVIENHGESSEMVLRDLYLTLDLFVFPSLCESIGFTLLEAMYYAIPIVAAGTSKGRLAKMHQTRGRRSLKISGFSRKLMPLDR